MGTTAQSAVPLANAFRSWCGWNPHRFAVAREGELFRRPLLPSLKPNVLHNAFYAMYGVRATTHLHLDHHDIILRPHGQLGDLLPRLPSVIVAAGEHASRKFIEFFTANIRNRNTRQAYARAARRFFDWCERPPTRARTIGADARRLLYRGVRAVARPAEREAAPRRDPHALRLLGRRPGREDEPGRRGPRPEARREEGQDARAFSRGGARTLRIHRTYEPSGISATGRSSASWSTASPASVPSLA